MAPLALLRGAASLGLLCPIAYCPLDTMHCGNATLCTHCRYEMGRQAANTKLSTNVSVRRVRVRGGNFKFRALRLDSGNFSWGSEAVTRKTRVLDVVYNSSNNELVGVAAILLAGCGTPDQAKHVARERAKGAS